MVIEKVIEREKLAKTHGILPILPRIVPNVYVFFATTKKISINLESLHFLTFSAKRHTCKIDKRVGHGKLRNGHG